MKILHLLRSEPDQEVRLFMAVLSRGEESEEFPLYRGEVDYDALLKKIFASDRLICWW